MKILRIFIIKEFIQFFRDPKMFRVVLIAPVIQLIFLGYAANRDILNADTALLNLDRSAASREYMRSVEESGYFSVNHYPGSYEELKDLIDDGTVFVGIVIPNDFESDINNHQTADIQLILDGSDGNKASIAAGYIQNITAIFSKNISLDYLQTSGIKVNIASSIEPEARVWYNPNLSTRNFFLPSIVGLILIIITINMTSLAIVKEREIGTLEQLIVTPLKPYQMILGKLIPFSIIGFVAVVLVLSVMRFWFGIGVKGSIPFLFLCTFVFMLSTLGLGLFVSTVSKTQQQAMITSAFLVMMPMIFLSGFSFPIENMPQIIQYITYIIPLKYFIIIIRGIVIKGLGFENLWPELTILFFMGVFILAVSSMRFNKRLE